MFMRGFSSFFLISCHFLKFQNGSQNGYKVAEMMIDSFNEIVWGSNSAMICQNKSLLTSASTSDSGWGLSFRLFHLNCCGYWFWFCFYAHEVQIFFYPQSQDIIHRCKTSCHDEEASWGFSDGTWTEMKLMGRASSSCHCFGKKKSHQTPSVDSCFYQTLQFSDFSVEGCFWIESNGLHCQTAFSLRPCSMQTWYAEAAPECIEINL